jgi:hypothetical protein
VRRPAVGGEFGAQRIAPIANILPGLALLERLLDLGGRCAGILLRSGVRGGQRKKRKDNRMSKIRAETDG